ncbi:MAG: DUF2178 domain-containing protein [Chloroflexota bacterium]
MRYQTFLRLRLIVVVMTGLLGAWAAASGHALVLVPVVIAGTAIMMLLGKTVREVVVDERVYHVAGRASYLTVRISAALMVVVGAVLVTLSRSSSPGLEPAGFTLAYAACGLLMVYWMAYSYYNRKLGGKE